MQKALFLRRRLVFCCACSPAAGFRAFVATAKDLRHTFHVASFGFQIVTSLDYQVLLGFKALRNIRKRPKEEAQVPQRLQLESGSGRRERCRSASMANKDDPRLNGQKTVYRACLQQHRLRNCAHALFDLIDVAQHADMGLAISANNCVIAG